MSFVRNAHVTCHAFMWCLSDKFKHELMDDERNKMTTFLVDPSTIIPFGDWKVQKQAIYGDAVSFTAYFYSAQLLRFAHQSGLTCDF